MRQLYQCYSQHVCPFEILVLLRRRVFMAGYAEYDMGLMTISAECFDDAAESVCVCLFRHWST